MKLARDLFLRGSDSFRKHAFWVAFVSSAQTASLVLMSAVLSVLVGYTSSEFAPLREYAAHFHFSSPLFWAIITAFTTTLIYWAISTLLKVADFRFVMEEYSYSHNKKWWEILFSIESSILMVILVTVAFLIASDYGNLKELDFARHIIYFSDKHGGGAFNLTIAAISIFAFVLTIDQLRDIRQRIGSFDALSDRLERMARKTNHDNPLIVISYTPAIGFLALPEFKWIKILNALTNHDDSGKCKTKIITLRDDQLLTWHLEFVNRSTRGNRGDALTKKRVMDAQEESKKIKGIINAHGDENYIEIDRIDLPGWYCFFHQTRAIIVTPLFLPIAGLDVTSSERLPPPKMVGYETSDQGIIDDLYRQFDYLMKAARENVRD